MTASPKIMLPLLISTLFILGNHKEISQFSSNLVQVVSTKHQDSLSLLKPKHVVAYAEVKQPLQASLFIEDFYSFPDISAEFVKEAPSSTTLGFSTVLIRAVDETGDYSLVEASLEVKRANETPLFQGISSKEVAIGDEIDYISGVSVSDQYGQALEFTVDTSGVNMEEDGIYYAVYRAEDKKGNVSEETAEIFVNKAIVPPVFEGLSNKTITVGDAVSYRSNVTALDYNELKLNFSVDSSEVDVSTPGTYKVYYFVSDRLGQTTEKTITITVKGDTTYQVNQMIDNIFAKIFKTGMSNYEKAEAIYNWCAYNINYSSSGPRTDIYSIAYSGLRGLPGDCYTYQAVSYCMLQRANIPVILMERISGTRTTHKWVGVNVGTGWYHFDPCNNPAKQRVFMFTDAQMEEITRKSDLIYGYSYHYYDYKTPLTGGVVME